MKVKELKTILSSLNDDVDVVSLVGLDIGEPSYEKVFATVKPGFYENGQIYECQGETETFGVPVLVIGPLSEKGNLLNE